MQNALRNSPPQTELEALLKSNHLFLYGLIAVCCAVELTLSLDDLGVIGAGMLRHVVFEHAAFWPSQLYGRDPNFATQPYAMFLTYAFLHGGLIHLSINMVSLWSLGRAVLTHASAGSFALLYVATSLCGAAGLILLGERVNPMVGVSGAIFGLIGTLVAWDYLDRHSNWDGIQDVARVILLLVGLNVFLWWATGGRLAWQTHLGGFVGGWIGALMIKRQPQ